MPRDANGNYSLPLPPVVSGETIQAAWANTTMDDIAAAVTDSLDRQGRGGMLTPFTFGDGTVATPGISWDNEPTMGIYRPGANEMRVAIGTNDVARWVTGGLQVWETSIPGWVDVLTTASTGTVPDGTATGQVPVWNSGSSIWETKLADSADITFNGAVSVLSGADVEAALESADAVLASHNTHIADSNIHWADAPNDGTTYNRRDGAWVESIAGVSDHGALNGLAVGDDHPQYLNNTRGDARYLQVGAKAADSTLWDGYAIVVTSTPGSDPNTIYMVPE